MKYIFICVFLVCFFTHICVYSQCLEADIAILVDYSGSEEGNEKVLTESVRDFTSTLPSDGVRISIIGFANSYTIWCPLGGNIDKALYAMSMTKADGGTYITSALDAAYRQLDNERVVPKIIVLISDGEISDMNYGISYLKTMKEKLPLVVYAIQIGGSPAGYGLLLGLTDNVTMSKDLAQALKALDLCP